MRPFMRMKKDAEVKARVDGQTKLQLARIAYLRGLDTSDLLREAIRDFLAKQLLFAPAIGK